MHARPEPLDQAISAAGKLTCGGGSGLGLEIERYDRLPRCMSSWIREVPKVRSNMVDADHIRAEFGEHHRSEQAWSHPAKVDDAQAVQRRQLR